MLSRSIFTCGAKVSGALLLAFLALWGTKRAWAADAKPTEPKRWYQALSRFFPFRPDAPSETGPASVYTRRSDKRGMFFRAGPQEVKLEGLPGLSPELAVPGFVWSLQTSISRALVANPSIVEAKLMLQRQSNMVVEANAKRLPQVAITGGHEWRDPNSLDRVGNSPLADRSYDIRLEVRQLLFDYHGLSNAVQRERLQTMQAKLALQLAAYRTVSLVKQHFDAVLFREATLANAQSRERSLKQISDFTQRRWKLGEQSELEALRAATELRLAQADVVKSQRDLQQVRIGFARQLYLPASTDPKTDFVLSGELAPADFSMPRDEALSLAIGRRLDLQTAQIQVKVADTVLKTVRSDAFPKLEASAGYGYRSSYYNYDHQINGWSVGVNGRWPIYDGNAVRARTQAYKAEQKVTQVRLEDLEQRVQSEVAELYAGMDLAKSALEAQGDARVLAQKSLTYARRSYELGQATLEQVLEIENVLLRSENAYAEAVVTLNATVAQLEFSVGGVLPGTRDVGVEVMP